MSHGGLLVLLRIRLAELAAEVVHKRGISPTNLLFDRADGEGVGDHLDQTAVRPGGNDLVRLEPKRQFSFSEDLIALGDKLHREGFLSQVIVCLHDHSEQFPCLETGEGRVLLDPGLLLLRGLQEDLVVVTVVEEVNRVVRVVGDLLDQL